MKKNRKAAKKYAKLKTPNEPTQLHVHATLVYFTQE